MACRAGFTCKHCACPVRRPIQLNPVCIRMAAILLRHQIIRFSNRAFPDTEGPALFPVRICLASASLPPYIVRHKGYGKTQPEQRQLGQPFLSAVMTAHPDSPPSVHGIGHAHLGLRNCAGGIIICNTHLAPALLSVPSRAPDKLVGAAPDSAPYRESVSLVILRGSPPEGRLSGTVYPLQSIVDQGNHTVFRVRKNHMEASSLYAKGDITADYSEIMFRRKILCCIFRLRPDCIPSPHLLQRQGFSRSVFPVKRLPLLFGAVPIAHLLHGGLFSAVRKYDSIAAEGIIRGPVPEVAAVSQHFIPIHIHPVYGLVNVIPYETALIHGELIQKPDIALHTAYGIAHVMHIFAQQIRLFRVMLQIIPHLPGRGVHTALHIADFIEFPVPVHTFVVHKPGGVLFMEIPAHSQDTGSCIGFISAGPPQYTWVVLIPFQHGYGPVHHAVLPLRQASRHIPGRLALSHLLPGTMAFQVRLIHNINAVLITEAVPQALIGIVAGAHRVDMAALQDFYILSHILPGDGPSRPGVPLMAVYTVDNNAFPVEKHNFVLYLKTAESNVHGNHFHHISARIPESEQETVQIRVAGGPWPDSGYLSKHMAP